MADTKLKPTAISKDVEIELEDVINFIENCNTDETEAILIAAGYEEPEKAPTSDQAAELLKNVTTVSQDEKLCLFLQNIDSIDYTQLKKFCDGDIIHITKKENG